MRINKIIEKISNFCGEFIFLYFGMIIVAVFCNHFDPKIILGIVLISGLLVGFVSSIIVVYVIYKQSNLLRKIIQVEK